jgi:hypothetical protein
LNWTEFWRRVAKACYAFAWAIFLCGAGVVFYKFWFTSESWADRIALWAAFVIASAPFWLAWWLLSGLTQPKDARQQ